MRMIKGTLPGGMRIEEVTHHDFEMREADVGDIMDAEAEADVTKPISFNAQMMVRQLVSVGDFKGPFTIGMIKRLHPADFRTLRAVQMELDALGESAPASGAAS